jgi:hypothetical protein
MLKFISRQRYFLRTLICRNGFKTVFWQKLKTEFLTAGEATPFVRDPGLPGPHNAFNIFCKKKSDKKIRNCLIDHSRLTLYALNWNARSGFLSFQIATKDVGFRGGGVSNLNWL